MDFYARMIKIQKNPDYRSHCAIFFHTTYHERQYALALSQQRK